MTSVQTTGLPISDIEYPTIIICGQGGNKGVLWGAFASQIIEFLQNDGQNVTTDGLDYQNMDSDDQMQWLANWSVDYIQANFPGLETGETPLDLISLMTTKSPDALIQAIVARNGGYDPCAGRLFKRKNRQTSTGTCENGFVHDVTTGYCYHLAAEKTDVDYCGDNSWEELQFFTDTEVTGFRALLAAGTKV
jgi:hypothetical protein